MNRHEIRLTGPRVVGTAVSAQLLRDVLAVVLEGSKRAVRIRTQGRSSAPGAVPAWIEAAADYTVELKPGSTVLDLEVPSLLEAAPGVFDQSELFPEIDPERSSFDYFSESLAAAVEGERHSRLYDKGLLEVFRRLERAVDAGADRITVDNGRRLEITRESVRQLADLEAEIPEPQYVRVAGMLDEIRHSDRTFTIVSTAQNQKLKGIAEPGHKDQLQDLWGKRVLVGGTAHFTPAGGVLRIEADRIRKASRREGQLWGETPRSIGKTASPSDLREPQGPRSGLNALIGRWPGDESDDEINQLLERIS